MAIYRIYPQKDTTIWSKPSETGRYANAGKDEILELGGNPDPMNDSIGRTKRILIQFDTEEIQTLVDSKTSGLISCSLYLPLADASELPTDFKIEVYPLSESWENGVGKLNDIPANQTGATWSQRDALGTQWSDVGGTYSTDSSSSISYELNSDNLDLELDVSNLVSDIYSGSVNNGFLIKLEDAYDDYLSGSISLKYYGADTNTIFRPYLEFKAVTDLWNPGDSILGTDIAKVSISNQKEQYINEGTARFRISAKPSFPARTFTTGSIYKTNYALPADAQYSVVDNFSNQTIIKYSPFTNINADDKGSYIDLDMSLLSPERYYKLKIKATLDNSTVLFEQDNLFKVVRNG